MSSTSWPQLPSWETSDLQSLGSAGDLSGVTPRAIAVIDKEESGGTGGAVNSEGYGGFFGEGSGQSYPAGTATPALLGETTQTAFEDQAEIASSAFASYLLSTGGTYVSAEEVYQSGSAGTPTPGSELFETYGFGDVKATTTGIVTYLKHDPLSGTGAVAGVATGVIGSAISSAESSFTSFLAEAVFVVAGVGLVVLGVWRAAKPKGSSSGGGALPDLAEVAAP